MSDPSLLSILPLELVDRFPDLEPPEARRLLSIIHRTGQIPEVTPAGIRRTVFHQVRDSLPLHTLHQVSRRPSSLDPFVKYAFKTSDGAIVESVRIPLEKPHRFVVCVSSQTGCAMACSYCATGRLGTGRSLTAWEIVDQVRHVRDDLPSPGRVHGIVFQGMGEPLANVESVIRAVHVMTDPSLQSIDGRAITVSSAGLLRPLPRLLHALPRIRLGISIGHANPERRRLLMPIEASNPLRAVLEVAADHARQTGIATMLSYTLLGGVNDGDEDADAFGVLLQQYLVRAGMAPRVSLVPYNPIGQGDLFVASDPERADRFRQRLRNLGVPVVRRYSGGSDVGAACGQLGMELMPRQAT